MDKRVEWSELPKELWPEIGKRLNATIDLLRFRSICKSWRSAISLPPSNTLSLTLSPPQIPIRLGKFCLGHSQIYRLEPLSHGHDASQNPSISSSKGWLIKIGQTKPGPLRLLDPFTNFRVKYQGYPSRTFPKVLNLLNFRVVELFEAYSVKYVSYILSEVEVEGEVEDEDEYGGILIPAPEVRRVVLFPKEVEGGRMVFALYQDGRLGVTKIGDENWTFMDDGNFHCDDIILHKGQLYVVDKGGTILWIDCSTSTLKLVPFSPFLCGFGTRKHLMESGGSLYVVDVYFEGEPDNRMGMFYEVVNIKVYKLDEEWGKWLDVKNLGDVLFVLGRDFNFSLSAQDYHGCEGNCIYFCYRGSPCVFRLENNTFKSPKLFWPCPTLFHPEISL